MIASNVNFNLYKSFVAVYEVRNISRAAAQLQITQPTVTYNIKELERQLNVKLFHTHPRGVEPTKDAHELYKFVSEGMTSIANGESAIREFNAQSTLTIRISVASGPAQKYVASAISAFNAKYPLVRFELTDAWAEEGLTKLGQHNTELVIGFVEPESAALAAIDLKSFGRVAIMGDDFAATNKIGDALTKKNIETLPMIIFQTSNKHYEKYVTAKPFSSVTNIEMMTALAGAGLGVGICLDEHVTTTPVGIRVVTANDVGLPPVTLRCAYNKDALTKPTRAFIAEICEVMGATNPLSPQ
ncbi:MAG: LysR family transcriptional regulator [Firmicutes bacterium]|nr:LysR family transcriptional regulator [Bacillota bacterium]